MAVQVSLAAGARVATGQVRPIRPRWASLTPTEVSVMLPVLVTR